VNFIFDADVASFFDSVSKDWLVRFVEHRIGDLRIIRLITEVVEGWCPGERGCQGQ
jgi:retron-type reverse transcriptase